MQLKEFLELVESDEIITISEPDLIEDDIEGDFIQIEVCKKDIKEKYLNYKVTGVHADFTYRNNAMLEIYITE